MAEQIQEFYEPVEQAETCDPCSLHEQTSEATTYCTVCEENLCELCTKAHSNRKVTKEHKPIPIQEKKTHLTKYCNSCSECPQEACKYCALCEEYLCSDCVNAHAKIKATKDHVPTHLAAESDESDRSCDICLQAGKKVKAEYFCQQCTELLCIECNDVHRNSKATRTHKPIPAADMPDSNNIYESRKCEPCGQSSNVKPAVNYYEQCEFLCDVCTDRHCLQKSTFSHQLKNASDIDLNTKYCDVCIKCGASNPAILSCKVCSEALCDKCVRSHMNQKTTRSHELLELKEQPTDKTAQETKMCNLCEHFFFAENSSKLL